MSRGILLIKEVTFHFITNAPPFFIYPVENNNVLESYKPRRVWQLSYVLQLNTEKHEQGAEVVPIKWWFSRFPVKVW